MSTSKKSQCGGVNCSNWRAVACGRLLPKKILYVITKSKPFGGAQRYVCDLASSFSIKHGDGTTCPVIHTAAAFGIEGGGPLKKKLEEAEVRTITIRSLKRDISLLKDFVSFFELIKIMRAERPDVVHLNSSKAAGLGAIAARIYNLLNIKNQTSIIFTIHGLPHLETWRPCLQKILIKFFTRLTVFLSHKTIAVCKRDYEIIKHWLFVRNKIYLIYNATAPINFLHRGKAREQILQNLSTAGCQMPAGSFWMATIAELHPNKGIELALKALASPEIPKNLTYVIIGDGEYKKKLLGIRKKLGLQKKVLFAGFIEDAAILLKAFDLFLLPSIKEGMPYTALEAVRAGVPAIITDAGEVSAIKQIGKDNIAVIKRGNETDILTAILRAAKRARSDKTASEEIFHKAYQDMLNNTLSLYLN